MKAMVLAAGRGSRLSPLTDICPKPLIRARGKQLIDYHLEAFARAGITEVIINVSYLGHMIKEALGDGTRYGVNIQYSHEPAALDIAGGVMNALPLLGSEAFLLVSADIFTDIPYWRLTLPHGRLAHLVIMPKPEWHGGDFSLSGDGCLSLEESGEKAYTYSGVGVFHPDFFMPRVEGKAAILPYLQAAARNNQLSGELFHGVWENVGTVEQLQKLEAT